MRRDSKQLCSNCEGNRKKILQLWERFLSSQWACDSWPTLLPFVSTVCITVRKGSYVQRVVLFVILEDAVLAQTTHSQSCTPEDSPLSSFRGTGMMNFFLKRKSSHRWAGKGISNGRNLSAGTRNQAFQSILWPYTCRSALAFCCMRVPAQSEMSCSCSHTPPS